MDRQKTEMIANRTGRWMGILWGGMCLVLLASAGARADVVIFHNGEYLYGTLGISDSTREVVITDEKGESQRFKRSQIRSIHPGMTRPAPGEILRATDFIHSGTAEILSITAEITTRKTIKTEEKELVVDVENGFNVSGLRLMRSTYPFFRREGAFLTAFLQNLTDRSWQGANFRLFFYDANNRLLTTKDCYVFRLPPVDANGRGGRVIEVDLPDVPYPLIKRIRFVRKF